MLVVDARDQHSKQRDNRSVLLMMIDFIRLDRRDDCLCCRRILRYAIRDTKATNRQTRSTLTCTGVHCTAIADDQTVATARAPQVEVCVLDLDHGAQEILLEVVRLVGGQFGEFHAATALKELRGISLAHIR